MGSPATARARNGQFSAMGARAIRGDSTPAGSVSRVGRPPSAAGTCGAHWPSKRCTVRRLASIDSTRRVTTGNESAGTTRRAASSQRTARLAVAGAMWLTVTVATACNKANASADTAASIPAGQELDLRKHPPILFEVFGERDDPRMVPLASLDSGKLRPIRLSPGGWRTFDRLYNRPGASYTCIRMVARWVKRPSSRACGRGPKRRYTRCRIVRTSSRSLRSASIAR